MYYNSSKGDYATVKTEDGKVISKNDPIIVAEGKLDTLLSAFHFAKYYNDDKYTEEFYDIENNLDKIRDEISLGTGVLNQSDLLDLDTILLTMCDPKNPFVKCTRPESMWLNECRVRCREAEVALVPLYQNGRICQESYSYMNRLSKYFYILSYNVEIGSGTH